MLGGPRNVRHPLLADLIWWPDCQQLGPVWGGPDAARSLDRRGRRGEGLHLQAGAQRWSQGRAPGRVRVKGLAPSAWGPKVNASGMVLARN